MGMRFAIHDFSQKEAISFVQEKEVGGKMVTQRLDVTDLLLLRWLTDFWANPKMEKITVDGNMYGWVSYKKVLEDLPILAIGKQALFRRFQKMVDFKILTHYTYATTEKGTRSMYGFGENYERLLYDADKTSEYSNTEGVGIQVQTHTVHEYRPPQYSNTEGVGIQVQNKDSSISDSSTNDSTIRNSSISDNIKEQTTPRKKTTQTYYPNDELLNQTFLDYITMRKQIKKPLTDRAIELAMKKLQDLATPKHSFIMDNDLAIKILEQSIMSCWQGLFPLKEERSNNNNKNDFDEWRELYEQAGNN